MMRHSEGKQSRLPKQVCSSLRELGKENSFRFLWRLEDAAKVKVLPQSRACCDLNFPLEPKKSIPKLSAIYQDVELKEKREEWVLKSVSR